MKCEICGKGPADGVTVYRANRKGVKGIWRCAAHPCAESLANQHDPEINAIEEALKGKPMKARDIIPGWPRGTSCSKPFEPSPFFDLCWPSLKTIGRLLRASDRSESDTIASKLHCQICATRDNPPKKKRPR